MATARAYTFDHVRLLVRVMKPSPCAAAAGQLRRRPTLAPDRYPQRSDLTQITHVSKAPCERDDVTYIFHADLSPHIAARARNRSRAPIWPPQ